MNLLAGSGSGAVNPINAAATASPAQPETLESVVAAAKIGPDPTPTPTPMPEAAAPTPPSPPSPNSPKDEEPNGESRWKALLSVPALLLLAILLMGSGLYAHFSDVAKKQADENRTTYQQIVDQRAADKASSDLNVLRVRNLTATTAKFQDIQVTGTATINNLLAQVAQINQLDATDTTTQTLVVRGATTTGSTTTGSLNVSGSTTLAGLTSNGQVTLTGNSQDVLIIQAQQAGQTLVSLRNASGAEVTSLDSSGNLSLGGDATIAGTLTVPNVNTTNLTATNAVIGSLTTTGQGVFTAIPSGSGVNQGTVYLNPVTANATDTLLGLAVNGTEKLRVDASGNFSNAGNLGTAGNLTVAGTTSLTGATTIGNSLSVGGATVLSGTLQAGASTLASLGVTGNTTVGGTLGVTGATSLSTLNTSGLATLNSAAITNNATVGGNLGVTGNTTIGGNLNVAGTIQGTNEYLTGTLSQSIYQNDDSLVVYYPFSETSGTTLFDKSGRGVDATTTNTTSTDGKYGLARAFNGTSSFTGAAGAGSNPALQTNSFTVSLWMKPAGDSTGYSNGLASLAGTNVQSGWTMSYRNPSESSNLLFQTANGVSFGADTITYPLDPATYYNRWTQVTASYDAPTKTMKLYVDGKLVATKVNVAIYIPPTSAQSCVGCVTVPGYGGDWFNGSLDEYKQYNKALSDDEVRTQYLGGLTSAGYVRADNFKVINEANQELLRVTAAGNVGIGTTAPTAPLSVKGTNSNATLGSELITTSDFTNAAWNSAGWTTTSTTATHNTGNTSALVTAQATPAAGNTYQVSYTFSGSAAQNSTMNVTYGGVTVGTYTFGGPGLSDFTDTRLITATNGAALSFAPNTTFNGIVSAVSIKLVTKSSAIITTQNSASTTALEVRSTSSTTNALIGLNAGQSLTTGTGNTALGSSALQNTTTATSNTAVGNSALQNNTTGANNSAFGFSALKSSTNGINNSAFGVNALTNNVTGTNNSAFGVNSMLNNTFGNNNAAFGLSTLQANTIGAGNAAFGSGALQTNTSGAYNVGVGAAALNFNTTGGGNVGVGQNALGSTNTGSNNVGIGWATGVSATTGNANTSGSQNTFIGYQAGPGSATQLQNSTAIGTNSVVTTSNALVLGCVNGVNGCSATTKVGIVNASPAYTLDVAGDINVSSGSVYRINGVQVCSASGCTVSSSSGILNGTSLQTAANFNIQSAGAASVGGVILGAVGQTADLLQLQTTTGPVRLRVSPLGTAQLNAQLRIGSYDYDNSLADGTTAAVISQSTNLWLQAGTSSFIVLRSPVINSAASYYRSEGSGNVAMQVRGQVGQTGDLLQLQDSTGTVLSKFVANGGLSVMGGSLSGGARLAVGASSSAAANGDIAIGDGSSASGGNYGAIAVGKSAQATGQSSAAFGTGASASGNTSLALGSAQSSATNSIGIGGNGFVQATGNSSIVLGSTCLIGQGISSVSLGSGHAICSGGGDFMRNITQGAFTYSYNATSAAVYARGGESFVGVGTVNTSIGSATVTGTSTTFTSQFTVGDRITVGSETYTVTAIASNTSLTVASNFTNANTGAAYTVLPAIFKLQNATGAAQLVMSDQGSIGLGTLNPRARLELSTTSASSTGQIIQGVSGQTADLLQFQNSSGTVSTRVDAGGNIGFANNTALYNASAGLAAGSARVEEATTNLVNNPSFETNTTNWSTLVGATMTRVSTGSGIISGQQALEANIGTANQSGVSYNLAPQNLPNATYTASIYVTLVSGDPTALAWHMHGSAGTCSNDFSPASLSIGETRRFTVTSNCGVGQPTSATLWRSGSSPSNAVVRIDAVQYEAKSYATSYADGSLGSGYAWTGTAQASTSTRAGGGFVADSVTSRNVNSSALQVAGSATFGTDTSLSRAAAGTLTLAGPSTTSTLQGAPGSGTDMQGSSINLAGGQGTGAASGGDINLQISTPTGINQSFVTGGSIVRGIVTDGTYIYWVNGSGSIARSLLNGTSVNQNFITGANNPTFIAVDGTYIYWSNYNTGTIGRALLDGSSPNQSFISGLSAPQGIAVNGTYIYYATGGSSIGRANLDGSSPNNSFITGASIGGIALDGTYIYWSNANTNAIGRALLDGSGVNNSFITGAASPMGITVNGSYIYWDNYNNKTIGRADLAGTNVNQTFISGAAQPTGVYVGGNFLYWTNQTNGTIGRASVGSSTANSLSSVLSLSGANGAAIFKNTVNSSSAFQVQNAAGTTVLNVDTTGSGPSLVSISTGSSNANATGLQVAYNPYTGLGGSITGVFSNPDIYSVGSVYDVAAYRAGIRSLNAATVIGSTYMFYATSPTVSSGAITTAYGLYVAAQKVSGVTNGYGIYQAGTSDANYFNAQANTFKAGNNATNTFSVTNSSSVPLLSVDTTNSNVNIQTVADNTLGSELITTTDFTNPAWTSTGWVTTSTTATHSVGNTSALSTTQVVPTIGAKYLVTYTLAQGNSAGSTLNVTFGGATVRNNTWSSTAAISESQVVTATTTGGLIFTPSSLFNGIVSAVSIKQLTTSNTAGLVVKNASGTATLEVRTSGSTANSFVGLNAGKNTTSGVNNAAFGTNSLQNNTVGNNNAAFGYGTLATSTTGASNSAFGYNSLTALISGIRNVGVGASALQATTTGSDNTAIGTSSLQANIGGSSNTAIGYASMIASTTASNNTAVGYGTLGQLLSGTGNAALGYGALQNTTTGDNNTAIGRAALDVNTTGSSNVALGFAANTIFNNQSNSVAIGAGTKAGSSNTVVLGDNSARAGGVATQTVIGASYANGSNLLSVGSGTYITGTIQQTTTTVTGTGTAWTTGMVGGTIYYSDGTSATVSSVNVAAQTMVVNVSKTVAALSTYALVWGGNNTSTTGGASIQNTADSTAEFAIQRANGTKMMNVDSTNVQVSVNAYSVFSGGLTIQDLTSPTVSVTNVGTAGATTYTYVVFACTNQSTYNCSSGSTAASTTTGNAVLDGTNFNRLSWAPIAGAKHYNIYRTVAGGTPSTIGLIAVAVTGTSLDDTGLVGNGGGLPGPSSGGLTVSGGITASLLNLNNTTQGLEGPAGGALRINAWTAQNVSIGAASGAGLDVTGTITAYNTMTAVAKFVNTGAGNGVNTYGALFKNSADSATAFEIQTQGATSILSVNSSTLTVTVKNLVVATSLTVNGHVITGNTSGTTTAAAQAGAGTTATCTVTGNDTGGRITINAAGTGQAAGAQCIITFAGAFGATPNPVVAPSNSNSAGVASYVNAATGTFTVLFTNAPVAGQSYTFNYFNTQ